ncbi:Cystathionine gamma-synthase [Coemansia sp. Benny D115]|nr:Cystathionine gamma-synthase [Coemansia sp. Benny D115]
MAPEIPLGEFLPPNNRYAVSVSLPKWSDCIGLINGTPSIADRMRNGYPRFFIAESIEKIVTLVKDQYALPNENAMIYPSLLCAERCVSFVYDQAPKELSLGAKITVPEPGQVRIVKHVFDAIDNNETTMHAADDVLKVPVTIYCVLFPADLFPVARTYWKHTGDGITARFADHCLLMDRLNKEAKEVNADCSKSIDLVKSGGNIINNDRPNIGSNVDVKAILRQRIANALSDGYDNKDNNVRNPSEHDVYLLSTGMGTVFHIHQALLRTGNGKSVCFGFPYTDTLKILEKFGPGAYFLGQGEGQDYDELERILEHHSTSPEEDPILAIFTECPSNPLLKTANLPRLRKLADQYGAALVVDETIGSFANVDVLSWADVVVSSLTKVFSGDSDVMGGSIVLNPRGSRYESLRATMNAEFEDLLWHGNALVLERNSRDFMSRVPRINANALAVAELLAANPKVARVYYPKFTTNDNYEIIKRPSAKSGYGCLLSAVFVGGESAASQFYDSLGCCKGPSLGTNFTLAAPYTILAHSDELDWVAQYGVSPHLVRISIGLEPRDELLAMIQTALDAIE